MMSKTVARLKLTSHAGVDGRELERRLLFLQRGIGGAS